MKRGVAAVLLVVACAAAGCGTSGDTSVADRPQPTGAQPTPAGAAEVRDLPGSTTDTSCGDPTASLRPAGPLPAPGDFPAGSTMGRIKARGKLIAGVDQNTYKFGYRNPFTGNLEGFDIDMARAMAKAILGDPNAIQFRVLNSDQRIPAVKNGDVDLVVETMTMNCERWKDVNFSSEYYHAGQRVLVKKDSKVTGIEQLGGKKVCAAAGSTSIKNIVNAASKPVGIQVPGWTDCLVMLQQNQVDAVSTDDTILAGLAAQDPFTEVVGEAFTDEPYGMAIAKENRDLVRFVNAVLEQMRGNGEWAQIYNKWLAGLINGPATPPAPRYQD